MPVGNHWNQIPDSIEWLDWLEQPDIQKTMTFDLQSKVVKINRAYSHKHGKNTEVNKRMIKEI